MQYEESRHTHVGRYEGSEVVDGVDQSGLKFKLNQLCVDVQKITKMLVDVVHGDEAWWAENMIMLAGQALNGLKEHMKAYNNSSLEDWHFGVWDDNLYLFSDPLEALVWLISVCRIDRMLIGVLPPMFIDEVELQWKLIAMNLID